jgi:hypothetical protein
MARDEEREPNNLFRDRSRNVSSLRLDIEAGMVLKRRFWDKSK